MKWSEKGMPYVSEFNSIIIPNRKIWKFIIPNNSNATVKENHKYADYLFSSNLPVNKCN